MNNYEIIKLVEEIVFPYFEFNMVDMYGDRGSAVYPSIEDINTLYFKKNGKDRKLIINKVEEKAMVEKIKNLNIGTVELVRMTFYGIYIVVNV